MSQYDYKKLLLFSFFLHIFNLKFYICFPKDPISHFWPSACFGSSTLLKFSAWGEGGGGGTYWRDTATQRNEKQNSRIDVGEAVR
jgi:hypothetical protein